MTENKQKWVGEYLQAVLEVHAQAVPNRIASPLTAISERLKELQGDSTHNAKRSQIRIRIRFPLVRWAQPVLGVGRDRWKFPGCLAGHRGSGQ
jgi:hypothetical protein